VNDPIEIVLMGEPIGKGRHRHRLNAKTGVVFTHPDPRTARFEDKLAWAAQHSMEGRELLTEALSLIVMVYRSMPASWSAKKRAAAIGHSLRPTGRPDADNFLKIVMDGLNKVVWSDDSLVVEAHVYKKYSERPRLEISVALLT
jgi:Holliday junction resolvase RusA-like endonuclease